MTKGAVESHVQDDNSLSAGTVTQEALRKTDSEAAAGAIAHGPGIVRDSEATRPHLRRPGPGLPQHTGLEPRHGPPIGPLSSPGPSRGSPAARARRQPLEHSSPGQRRAGVRTGFRSRDTSERALAVGSRGDKATPKTPAREAGESVNNHTSGSANSVPLPNPSGLREQLHFTCSLLPA